MPDREYFETPWGERIFPRKPKDKERIWQWYRGLWTQEEMLEYFNLLEKYFKFLAKGVPVMFLKHLMLLRNASYNQPYLPRNMTEDAGLRVLAKKDLCGSRKVQTASIAVEKERSQWKPGPRTTYHRLPPKDEIGYYPNTASKYVIEKLSKLPLGR